jgi:acyl-CoA synthetase (AMP-forming)/AMP-acid ligase II
VTARFDNLMMNYPLTLTHFFQRSRRLFAKKTIATRVPGREMFRYTYADFAERTTREWPPLAETDAAAMCYTSGTTGHPTGVVSTHRAMFRHCLAEATTDAVIAVPHLKWVERPLACVVPKPGRTLAPAEIIEFLRPQLARWALPDAVEIIGAVPKTSVGKFDKTVLRERYKNRASSAVE